METVARRSKRPVVRERYATPQELAEEHAKWLRAIARSQFETEERERAQETQRRTEQEGNLCKMLTVFAAWRPCDACGALTLFCDADLRTTGRYICGPCEAHVANILADKRQLRPTFHDRVAAHLRALLGTPRPSRVTAERPTPGIAFAIEWTVSP